MTKLENLALAKYWSIQHVQMTTREMPVQQIATLQGHVKMWALYRPKFIYMLEHSLDLA
jgi:hypothetical protein